jgi:hypothetical protein
MKVRISAALIGAATALAASALAMGPALASSHASASGEITGPEVIAGTVHGKAALANTTKIPLVWQGLVSTHSVITLGGSRQRRC